LAACTAGPVDDEPSVVDSETEVDEPVVLPEPIEEIGPVDYIVRASLDLRGIRPSPEEIEAVLADPTQAPVIAAGYADDWRFGKRVAELFGEVFLTFSETTFVLLDYWKDLDPADMYRSIGHEPLRVLARIADHDLSYAELVTGDWTMANEVLAEMWPVAYPAGETGWQLSRYTDGRPAAGVLAANGMWWQYGSMANNLNRGRANAYSRIFLCQDYLENEIDFNSDQPLDSEEALGNAIRTDPARAGCHDTLDPLAAHFFGFWYFAGRKQLPSDAPFYHPGRELLWQELDGLPPAFRGDATNGLAELGRRTVEDPAYAKCFVDRSFEQMLRRNVTRDDRPVLDDALASFLASDMNIRELYRYIVQSPLYRERGGEGGLKVVTPTLLGSQIEAATNFEWVKGDWDLMQAPQSGLTALGGAVDGVFRTVRAEEPITTIVLVQKRLAESGAMHVAAHDLEGQRDPRLLTLADATHRPDTDREVFVAQIQDLHLRVLSKTVAADDPQIDETIEIWETIYGINNNATEAWAGVIVLVLRDPAMVVY
jgi:hypothetical protein